MNFRRINESYPISGLRSEIDRLFNNFVAGEWSEMNPFSAAGGRGFPALNIWEDEQALYAEAEVPGLRMEDIEVLLTGDELTIKGERREARQEGVSQHRRERGVGAFCRMVRLPTTIDAAKVQARLQDGVLTITLPKSAEARPRKIEVKTSGV